MEKSDQYRCPSGEDGREIIESMNDHHRPLTEWALSKLPEIDPKWILDIGCGGGMLIGILGEKYPEALIDGVDISKDSAECTLENNRDMADAGRLNVSVASVSDLPFDVGTFDLITAVETYFFWPEQESDIKKAADRLVPGGILMIASEAYPHPDFDERNNRHSDLYGMKLLENDVLAGIMENAGLETFYEVSEKDNWVVLVGRRI